MESNYLNFDWIFSTVKTTISAIWLDIEELRPAFSMQICPSVLAYCTYEFIINYGNALDSKFLHQHIL